MSAALAQEGATVAAASEPARSGHSLLELVDRVFADGGRKPEELAAVVAVGGPGSFTGVRVTLATAMGIDPADAEAGPQRFSISSLAALALQAGSDATTILALVDALRGNGYHQRFVREEGALRELGEAARGAIGEIDLEGVDTVVSFLADPFAGRATPAVFAAAPLAETIAREASGGRAAALLRSGFAPSYLSAPSMTPPAAPGP
jgi:tRNA threonylcarbamoyl adenosine modification protein YeaZ